MWIGQEPDYNVLDFNFMFSRQCASNNNNGLAGSSGGLMRSFDGPTTATAERHAELCRESRRVFVGAPQHHGHYGNVGCATGGSLRPMRCQPLAAPNVERLRDGPTGGSLARNTIGYRADYCNGGGGEHPTRPPPGTLASLRSAGPAISRGLVSPRETLSAEDPFRSWELNAADNSFRPAGAMQIRRITDGTFPAAATNAWRARVVPGALQARTEHLATADEATGTPAGNVVDALLSPTEVDAQSNAECRRYSENTEDDQDESAKERNFASEVDGEQNKTEDAGSDDVIELAEVEIADAEVVRIEVTNENGEAADDISWDATDTGENAANSG